MKKMSYVAMLNDVIEGRELTAEHIERATALRDQLAKRNSVKSGKPTKAQLANAALSESIIGAMTAGTVYTIAEIKALVPELGKATPQKISPLCRKLVADGRLTADKVKGKAVYTLA